MGKATRERENIVVERKDEAERRERREKGEKPQGDLPTPE